MTDSYYNRGMNKHKLPSPKAVLFDWDNTLVDSLPTTLHAINAVMEHYGRPLVTMERLQKGPGKALRETFPIMFGDDWETAADIYYKAYNEVHMDLIQPHPHAQDLLDYLYQQKMFLGVVSNKHGDNLRLEVANLGWEKYFREIVGSKDTEQDKPSHVPVELALAMLPEGLGPHIWFIGDSLVDMATAKNSSLTGIFINSDENIARVKEVHPELISFSNLMELLNFVKLHL
jgi:phosphoglycolate phosphatase